MTLGARFKDQWRTVRRPTHVRNCRSQASVLVANHNDKCVIPQRTRANVAIQDGMGKSISEAKKS
jgi:hypothetical protein